MDTGKGYFEFVNPDKAEAVRKNKSHPVFEVGQVVRIDGSTFRITKIGKHFMTLKLLPTRGECALPPEARAAKDAP